MDSTQVKPPEMSLVMGLPRSEVLDRYAFGVENFDRRLFELKDAELDTAFFPEAGVGRWPARTLLGHLADAELQQVHRLRRTAAEDHPVFSLWDENAFIESGMYGTNETGPHHPAGAFVAVLHTLRKWTAQWLRHLPEEGWDRKGLHPERGEQSMETILAFTTWHFEHHAWFLNRKIELLLAQRA